MANKKLDLSKNVQRIASRPAQAQPQERQPTIAYPISTRGVEKELPTLVGTLSARLQELARQYIGARRRSGEALLEAVRWLSEARAEAQHGEWQVFLEATTTSDDTAERLLNIHTQAMQNPQFAEAVSRNWLSQTAAALLARPSTPPEVLDELLSAPAPPSVAEVQKKIRQPRRTAPATNGGGCNIQNPQVADFEARPEQPGGGLIASVPAEHVLQMLQAAAASVGELAALADTIPANTLAEQAVTALEHAVTIIRQSLAQRANKSAF
jgi:hypothetical protein